MSEQNQIIQLSYDDTHITEITIDKIVDAKVVLLTTPKNDTELLNVLVAMNLINAALKRKEFKSKEKYALIHYGMLKPKVSRLFHNIIMNREDFNIAFYINPKQKCAYIEIKDLQFSFHNITINETLKVFVESDLNNPKEWKGVRLQKIAGELFDYIIKKEA